MKIFLLFVLTVTFTFSQTKYLVYFKDKGINPIEKISKESVLYKEAVNSLTKRAIERRKKTLGEDYIEYEDLPISKEYINILSNEGLKIIHQLKWFNAVSVYLSKGQIASIKKLPFIRSIVPVNVLKFKQDEIVNVNYLSKPAEMDYGSSFGQLQLSEIPAVHSKGITGEGILIGVLDTGFDWKRHESLMHVNVVSEYDFVQGDSITTNQTGDRDDQHSHGTLVFSVVGGYFPGKLIGASFGSSFLLAKTEYVPAESHQEEDNYAAALEWMENQGVDITTSSLGYSEFDDTTYSYTIDDLDGKTTIVARAVKLAFQRGVVTLTAAGNEGNSTWHFITSPADEQNILAVGSVDSLNQLASYSGRGPTADGRIKPDILTQGTAVYGASASTVSSYGRGTGTSLAAPIGCGIAGLLLSAFPHLTNIQVRDIMHNASDNFDSPNNLRGYGLTSARKAIEFPNISYQSGSGIYSINKIFITDKVNPSSVKLFYSNGVDSTEIQLVQESNIKFRADLPLLPSNQQISFYYTFRDSLGNTYREPSASGSRYFYSYGTSNITLTPDPPYDYGILSQNYPNPFNSSTTIKFLSTLNQNAEIRIFNSIGERVKTYIMQNTINGENTIIWNGKNEDGGTVSSGVYIYQLIVNGNLYSRKMILLK